MDYSKFSGGNYVYLPKVGEELEFELKSVNIVTTGRDEFHFHKTVTEEVNGKKMSSQEMMLNDEGVGFHVECDLADGKKLHIRGYAGFMSVFKDHNLQAGDKVKVKHTGKGTWEVEKNGKKSVAEQGEEQNIPF